MTIIIQHRSVAIIGTENVGVTAAYALYEIIGCKGFTNSAIGVVIARIVKAILEDEKSVLPVSVCWQGEYGIADVCMSRPAVVGLDGVSSKVVPRLNGKEVEGLDASARVLRDNISEIDLKGSQ